MYMPTNFEKVIAHDDMMQQSANELYQPASARLMTFGQDALRQGYATQPASFRSGVARLISLFTRRQNRLRNINGMIHQRKMRRLLQKWHLASCNSSDPCQPRVFRQFRSELPSA